MNEYRLYRKQRANIIHWYIKLITALLRALRKANTDEDIIDIATDIMEDTAQFIVDIKDL